MMVVVAGVSDFKRRNKHGVLKAIVCIFLYLTVAGMFLCILKGGNDDDDFKENR